MDDVTNADLPVPARRVARWVVWWTVAALLVVIVPAVVGLAVHERRARDSRDAQQDRIACVTSDLERGPRTGRLCSDLSAG